MSGAVIAGLAAVATVGAGMYQAREQRKAQKKAAAAQEAANRQAQAQAAKNATMQQQQMNRANKQQVNASSLIEQAQTSGNQGVYTSPFGVAMNAPLQGLSGISSTKDKQLGAS